MLIVFGPSEILGTDVKQNTALFCRFSLFLKDPLGILGPDGKLKRVKGAWELLHFSFVLMNRLNKT